MVWVLRLHGSTSLGRFGGSGLGSGPRRSFAAATDWVTVDFSFRSGARGWRSGYVTGMGWDQD